MASPQKTKIAAVVVTFNRKELLYDNLQQMLQQTHPLNIIYVIDNASTDGTYEHIKSLLDNHSVLKYIRLSENLGGAGGFYHGLKHAYENGMDYIWGMDDDSWPESDALEVLWRKVPEMPESVVLWSNIVMRNEQRHEVVHWRAFENDCQQEYGFTFVGFFIPRCVIERIGFPRADLFILFDEVEYSERVLRANIPIYRLKNSRINHPYINNVITKNIGPLKLDLINMASWKWYYCIRNGILIYCWNSKKKFRMLLLSFWILWKAFLVDRKNLMPIFDGLFDGIRGKSGQCNKIYSK